MRGSPLKGALLAVLLELGEPARRMLGCCWGCWMCLRFSAWISWRSARRLGCLPVAGRGVAMGAAWDWTDEHVRADLSWIMKTRESIIDHSARGGG